MYNKNPNVQMSSGQFSRANQILKLLSEEVFDFSRDEMTSAKAKKLKESFNNDFSLIFQLCEFIMSNSTKTSLLVCTFQAASSPRRPSSRRPCSATILATP